MISWFASPYYSLLYAHRNDAEAENFVKVLLEKLNLHPLAKVLDVGCGRGRYARALAKYGFEVDAIDYAVQPVDLPEGVRFYYADYRDWTPPHLYDLVGSFFSSFGHTTAWESIVRSMKALRHFVRPGGYLVLDYLNIVRRNPTPLEIREVGGVRFEIERWQDSHGLYKRIRVRTGETEKVYEEVLYKLTQGDLAMLAERVGLEVLDWWGDYEGGPFLVEESPRLILVGRAPL
jgi:SAM-dependent methyltransferase